MFRGGEFDGDKDDEEKELLAAGTLFDNEDDVREVLELLLPLLLLLLLLLDSSACMIKPGPTSFRDEIMSTFAMSRLEDATFLASAAFFEKQASQHRFCVPSRPNAFFELQVAQKHPPQKRQ